MIRVLIVDDHKIVRYGLRTSLANTPDIEVIGEAANGEEAIRLVRELKPHVVLMDIQLPGMSGLEATEKLLKVYPNLKILGLSAHDEDPFPASFVQTGAAGYLSKNSDIKELVNAIHSVHAGHAYITPKIAHHLVSANTNVSLSPLNELSKRELQVMWMILKGHKIIEIAEKINLSVKTVSTYRTRILQKLGIKNNIELTQLAMRHGILDDTHLKKAKK